jgi:hypothetical protein
MTCDVVYPIDGIDMLVHNKNLKHKVQKKEQ